VGGETEDLFFLYPYALATLYTYYDLILSFNLPCLMRCKVSDQWAFFIFSLPAWWNGSNRKSVGHTPRDTCVTGYQLKYSGEAESFVMRTAELTAASEIPCRVGVADVRH